jgi:hypothetical protein
MFVCSSTLRNISNMAKVSLNQLQIQKRRNTHLMQLTDTDETLIKLTVPYMTNNR